MITYSNAHDSAPQRPKDSRACPNPDFGTKSGHMMKITVPVRNRSEV